MKTQTPAEIIRDQIGSRAFRMMGTNQIFQDDDGRSLVFNIRGSRQANKAKVELTDRDDYTVSFYKVAWGDFKHVAEYAGVHVDNLREIIEDATGLYLSL